MMKRQATYMKFLKMGRVSNDQKKKLGNGTMALKCKGFLKEDIPNTTLEHLIKEINKK